MTTTQKLLPEDRLELSIDPEKPGHVYLILNGDDLAALEDFEEPDYVQYRSIVDMVESLIADCVGDSGVAVGDDRVLLEQTADVFEQATARLRQTLS